MSKQEDNIGDVGLSTHKGQGSNEAQKSERDSGGLQQRTSGSGKLQHGHDNAKDTIGADHKHKETTGVSRTQNKNE